MSAVTGLRGVLRLVLRRSRWFYLSWVLALAVLPPATAAAYETIIDPRTADLLIATMTGNPTMRAMLGPPVDLTSAGGFATWRVGTFCATVAGVMAVLGVVRSTRADEEEGRIELLRSTAVGRHVPLVAAVAVALGACAALGALTTAGMLASGAAAAGSAALGLGTAGVGAVFVGVAAVCAQVTSTARGARTLGLAVLGLAYTLRAVADAATEDSPLRPWAWAAPVQWMALARPFGQERWWVLALPLVTTVVLLALALALEARRDHGSGIVAVRSGSDRAGALLTSPEGLVWRLQRGTVVGWVVGMVVFALAMGSLTTSFEEMLRDVPQLSAIFQRMGRGTDDLVDAFFVAMLAVVSVVLTVPTVLLLHRLRTEEHRGGAELVLSTGTSRLRWLGAHLLVAALAPTLLLVATGALLALGHARATDDPGVVSQVTGAAAALAPGALLVLGLAVLLHGWVPRWDWLIWAVVGWSLFVVWVGAALGLPEWLVDLTPWARLPSLPVEPMDWPGVLGTTALAAGLTALGAVGYRRRDLSTQ